MAILSRKEKRTKRHNRARKKLTGTAARPRLAVCRSNKHISAQIIDDENHVTLCSAFSYSPELKASVKGGEKSGAEVIGKTIAEKAIKSGLKSVIFDCGGNLYHGRVEALAEAARKAGLKF